MKYDPLPLQAMQGSGAYLLRALQNDSMALMDLLVREAVQNSMDAALQRGQGGTVCVDFHLRDHSTETIATILRDGINRPVLMRRYPNGGRLLEIRDSQTEGLTGPLSHTDIQRGEHGNLLKLVYGVGRTRTDEGAGGSWGLGKTCYFRAGAGLVFYYSRIRDERAGYAERLVASLIEDETNDELLQRELGTGICWWGGEQSRPLTVRSQIHAVLADLRIQPFTGDDTGTSVIIPFLRRDLIPALPEGELRGAWWLHKDEDYLAVALQRWFCTRLDNPNFATGPRLMATVNGKPIQSKRMLPLFRAIQALYNRVVSAPSAEDDYLDQNGVTDASICIKPINLRNGTFSPTGEAGKIAAVMLDLRQLGMTEPDNLPDPVTCALGVPASDPLRPIVTFIRRPGMAVCWDDSTDTRSWCGGLSTISDGRHLIALFVPDQNRRLSEKIVRATGVTAGTLEAYLRRCERADHNSWVDLNDQDIVRRIQSNCGKVISAFGTTAREPERISPSIRMARNLADLVLPRFGGTDGRHGRKQPPVRAAVRGLGRSRAEAVAVDCEVSGYTSDSVELQWSLRWGDALGIRRDLVLSVDLESTDMCAGEWLAEMKTSFPFSFAHVALDEPEVAAVVISTSGDSVSLIRRQLHSTRLTGRATVRFATPAARELRAVLTATVPEQGERV